MKIAGCLPQVDITVYLSIHTFHFLGYYTDLYQIWFWYPMSDVTFVETFHRRIIAVVITLNNGN